MLSRYESRKVYIASEPVDMRMSLNALSELVADEINQDLLNGSIFVFYNKAYNKVKCIFWDNNGIVMYYKKLMDRKFKFKQLAQNIDSAEGISINLLEHLLQGASPTRIPKG